MSSRSRSLLLTAVVAGLAAGGVAFGSTESLVLATAAAAVLALSLARSATTPRKIEVSRVLTPVRCAVGEEYTVKLTFRNRSRRRTSPLMVTDSYQGHPAFSFKVAPIEPSAAVSFSYHLPTSRRGIFTAGPVTARTIDPLGLFNRSINFPTTESRIAVHPESWTLDRALSWIGADTATWWSDSGGTTRVGVGDEFASLSEYTPGDDVRRIHWPTTARLGRPIVRRNEAVETGGVTVVVDARGDASTSGADPAVSDGAFSVDDPAFERAISAAASLVRSMPQIIQRLVVLGADAPAGSAAITTDGIHVAERMRTDRDTAVIEFLDDLCALRRGSVAPDLDGDPIVLDLEQSRRSWAAPVSTVLLITPRAFADLNRTDDRFLLASAGAVRGVCLSTNSASQRSPSAHSEGPSADLPHGPGENPTSPRGLAGFRLTVWDGSGPLGDALTPDLSGILPRGETARW